MQAHLRQHNDLQASSNRHLLLNNESAENSLVVPDKPLVTQSTLQHPIEQPLSQFTHAPTLSLQKKKRLAQANSFVPF